MRKWIIGVIIFTSISMTARVAHSDMFGGDDLILAQILANALQELTQLKNILQSGQQSLELIQEINQGINDSLGLAHTLFPNRDPGIYRDWSTADFALRNLESIYGAVPSTSDSQVQQNNDQSTAEAIALNNSIYNYSQQVDQTGDSINSQSHVVSPGGAAKLTAQAMGVMLNVMNQGLRTQATGLKLQAQTMAEQNRKEKLSSDNYSSESSDLSSAMNGLDTQFQMPRF
jgi:hypothetical protein